MELRKAEDELSSLDVTYRRLCNTELQEDIDDIQPLIRLESVISSDDVQDDANTAASSIVSAADFLEALTAFRERLDDVKPVVEKFRLRLTMKDPVTNAPRYGKKTIERVERLIEKYNHLHIGIDDAFREQGGTDAKVSIVQRIENHLQVEKDRKRCQKDIEEAKRVELSLTMKKKEDEKALEAQRIEEEIRRRQEQEREDLRIRAEEARTRRIENEQQALEDEREAERAFISSVEVGPNGVKSQLQMLRESCNGVELRIAIRALHTIFSQIASRPEEIQFRRIRRDHPKFEEDIGRHHGGKELLVAAGFTFKEIDGIKCFFSAEPDLATDMDGWSSWYQLMKDTLNILDEELSSIS